MTSPSEPSNGNGQQLLDFELRDGLKVGPGKLGSIVGPEDFLGDERFGGDSFRKSEIELAGRAFLRAQPYPERALLQQPNEGAAEAQEIRRPDHKGFQERIQVSDRAELGRDFQQLVQLVSLAASGRV